jgi:hypothetical protein
LPECPICEKEFESRGSTSYALHVQTKHPLYWAKAKQLRLYATVNLIISFALTILLVTLYYSFDELAYVTMGLATLFLAISAAFSLRERGLDKRFKSKIKRKGSKAKKENRTNHGKSSAS